MLGVPTEKIVVELVSNGGAFGGKEDMSNQGQTALAAWLLQRPVKCTLSREESLFIHPKRHPIRMEYWAGCDAEGMLTGLKARMIGDSGPVRLGRHEGPRARRRPRLWPLPAVRRSTWRRSPCGPTTPSAVPSAALAPTRRSSPWKGVIDRLAEQVGLDSWEMRYRNAVTPGVVWGPGQVMDEGSLGARQCLEAVKPAYDAGDEAGKAVGLGLWP